MPGRDVFLNFAIEINVYVQYINLSHIYACKCAVIMAPLCKVITGLSSKIVLDVLMNNYRLIILQDFHSMLRIVGTKLLEIISLHSHAL